MQPPPANLMIPPLDIGGRPSLQLACLALVCTRYQLSSPLPRISFPQTTSDIQIRQSSKGCLSVSRVQVLSLFGYVLHCKHGACPDHVRYRHYTPNKLPVWPLEVLFELLSGLSDPQETCPPKGMFRWKSTIKFFDDFAPDCITTEIGMLA